MEKLAWSSTPRDTTAVPSVTGSAACRSIASASWATYSRIITPELPGGPSARNAGRSVNDGSTRSPSRAADSSATWCTVARAWSSATARYAVWKCAWWKTSPAASDTIGFSVLALISMVSTLRR